MPLFDWPVTDFPRYKYPLEENVKENVAEDQRCLAKVEEHLEAQVKKGNPCAGLIVEPVQSEGGDHHGSPAWFQVKFNRNIFRGNHATLQSNNKTEHLPNITQPFIAVIILRNSISLQNICAKHDKFNRSNFSRKSRNFSKQ